MFCEKRRFAFPAHKYIVDGHSARDCRHRHHQLARTYHERYDKNVEARKKEGDWDDDWHLQISEDLGKKTPFTDGGAIPIFFLFIDYISKEVTFPLLTVFLL